MVAEESAADPQRNFPLWNTTAVANTACVSLYAEDAGLRAQAEALLQKYAGWRRWESRKRALELVVAGFLLVAIVCGALFFAA